MAGPTLVDVNIFRGLVDIADCISLVTPHSEPEVLQKLGLVQAFEEMVSHVIPGAVLRGSGHSSYSLGGIEDMVAQFSGDKKGEYPLRIVLLGALAKALSAKSKEPEHHSLAKKTAKTLRKLASYSFMLIAKRHKRASDCVKRWSDGDTHFNEYETARLDLHFLPLSLTLKYLPLVKSFSGKSLLILNASDLEKLSDRMISARLEVGQALKCYLLEHHRSQLSPGHLWRLDSTLSGGRMPDQHTVLRLVKATVDPLSNAERLDVTHKLLVTWINPEKYQPVAASALLYLVQNISNETSTIERNGVQHHFSLNEAHVRLCHLLTQAHAAETFRAISEAIFNSLSKHSASLLQNAVEETLSAVSRVTHREAHCQTQLFLNLCDIVETLVKAYRVRLSGRLSLLVATLCHLMGLLVNGEHLAAHWNRPLSSDEKSVRAMCFVNLVRRVCEPTAGAARHRSETRKSGGGGKIDDATVEIYRRDVGNNVFVLLIRYAELVLQEGKPQLSAETEMVLRPGLSKAVFGVVKDAQRDFMGGSLGANEWALLRDMYGEYKRGKGQEFLLGYR